MHTSNFTNLARYNSAGGYGKALKFAVTTAECFTRYSKFQTTNITTLSSSSIAKNWMLKYSSFIYSILGIST